MPGASGSGSEAGGFGLIGVSERAELLRGKVAIHSEAGQGTTVSVRIPLLGGDKHEQ
jgi:two-component system sensor histidine kinase DegS